MYRFVLRLAIVLVATGALGSTLASAAAPQAAHPSATPAVAAVLIPPQAADRRSERFLIPRPAPSVTPAPRASAKPVQPAATRAAVGPRPIPPPVIDAQEVALVNLDTGRVLWQSNARTTWAPASLTKIFTAMVAVDLMGLNTMVTVPTSITQLPADSTVMGLTPGERLTVRDLLYGVFRQRRSGDARLGRDVPTDVHRRHERQGGAAGPAWHAFREPDRSRRRRALLLGR